MYIVVVLRNILVSDSRILSTREMWYSQRRASEAGTTSSPCHLFPVYSIGHYFIVKLVKIVQITYSNARILFTKSPVRLRLTLSLDWDCHINRESTLNTHLLAVIEHFFLLWAETASKVRKTDLQHEILCSSASSSSKKRLFSDYLHDALWLQTATRLRSSVLLGVKQIWW